MWAAGQSVWRAGVAAPVAVVVASLQPLRRVDPTPAVRLGQRRCPRSAGCRAESNAHVGVSIQPPGLKRTRGGRVWLAVWRMRHRAACAAIAVPAGTGMSRAIAVIAQAW